MSTFRFRWPWRATGRHYKLMLATSLLAALLIPVLWVFFEEALAVALFLWLLTLVVQWLCIEPPGVEEKDLH